MYNICKNIENTTIFSSNIEKVYKKYPVFLKVSLFDLDFIKSFNNEDFMNLILDTHIIIRHEDNTLLIARIEFFIDSKFCIHLDDFNNKCFLNKKHSQCLIEKQMNFYPISKYEDILKLLKIEKKSINIEHLKEYYNIYFKNLKKFSNTSFALKNFQIILNANLDNLLSLIEKKHFISFYSPIVSFDDFNELFEIQLNSFKKHQKRIIAEETKKQKSPMMQQLYLSALNFFN